MEVHGFQYQCLLSSLWTAVTSPFPTSFWTDWACSCSLIVTASLMSSSNKPRPFPSPSLPSSCNYLFSQSLALFLSFLLLLLQWLLPPNYLWALQTTPLAPQDSIILVLFSCLLTSRFARCWTAVNITIFENLDTGYTSCKSRNVSSYGFVTMAAKI